MTNTLTHQLAQRLRERETELVSQLHDASLAAAAAQDPSQDVRDFKDMASEEADAAADEVAMWHAAQELSQVTAALRRVADGSYGTCRECGEAIAESRLLAMPAAAFCTGCQSTTEHAARTRH
jgi:DnaK suppressor protein